jgi:hypothetical protein
MTQPATAAALTPQEEILGQLALALQEASDCDAVARQFAERYPEHAEAIAAFAGTERLIRFATPTPPPARLEPDQRLGPFRIVRFIAAGGMGEIYEAEQLDLKRSVALVGAQKQVGLFVSARRCRQLSTNGPNSAEKMRSWP